MSTDAENSLATNAHKQVELCCESACDKLPVKAYIEALEEENSRLNRRLELYEKLHQKLMHEYPENSGSYFICGSMGEKDDYGIPSHLLICPQYGADGFYVYKKEKDYSAPEW